MLAVKGANHIVRATVGGLAHQARVSVEACRMALEKLSNPDPDGLDQPYQGRRIQAVDHGWLILNGEAYRSRRDNDEYRKQYQADWIRAKRLREKLSTEIVDGVDASTNVDHVDLSDQIRSDTDKEKSSSNGSGEPSRTALPKSVRSSPMMTGKAVKELADIPAYKGIDVEKEAWKFKTWCETNNKTQSRRRFVNWLNRIT